MPDGSGLPRVGVLHAPSAAANLREIHVAARGMCCPVLIFQAGVADGAPGLVRVAKRLGEAVVVPDGAAQPELSALALDGLVTFKDSQVETADRWTVELGLLGAGTVADPWDKLVQRERLALAGVSSVRALAVDGQQEFLAATDKLGLPAVLKPRRSTASVGLSFLPDGAGVARELERRRSWHRLILEEMLPSGPHPSGIPWLADYISLETVSTDRERFHVAVMDKFPLAVAAAGDALETAVRETGDVLPSRLPPAVLAEIYRATNRALDALGVANRVTHTEFKISARAEIIEINGRLGGEAARLSQLTGGPDLVRAAFAVCMGLTPDLSGDTDGFAASLYPALPQRHEKVRSDVSRQQLWDIPGIAGIDGVACHGDEPRAHGFRAASLTLKTPDQVTLEDGVAAAIDAISGLFAEDGTSEDPWYRSMRRWLAAPQGGG